MKIINCKIKDLRAHSIDSSSRLIEVTTERGDSFLFSTLELENILIERGELCLECRGEQMVLVGEVDNFTKDKCFCN